MDREAEIELNYFFSMPNKYTFKAKKIREYVECWCKGRVLNLFAGETKIDVDEYRNHKDALEFINGCREKFDTVILDPPYSMWTHRLYYKGGGHNYQDITVIRNALPRVLKENARIITLGYNSNGMSKQRGFKKIAIALVHHGGTQNDTIITVEEATNGVI